MTEYVWRGQTAEFGISVADGGATVTIGVLQDAEIRVTFEDSELRGAGSIKRQDVQRTEVNVVVSGTVMAFDEDTYDSLIDWDSSNTEINDADTPPLFDVTFAVEPTSTSKTKTYTVEDVYFSDIPMSASKDDWVELSLEGNGKDISGITFST